MDYPRISETLLEFLYSKNKENLTLGIRVLGNMVMISSAAHMKLFKGNRKELLERLFLANQHNDKDFKNDSFWLTSNLAANSVEDATAIVEHDIINQMLNALPTVTSSSAKKNLIYAFANLVNTLRTHKQQTVERMLRLNLL